MAPKKLSAATRKAMSLAQKKRWAAIRKAKIKIKGIRAIKKTKKEVLAKLPPYLAKALSDESERMAKRVRDSLVEFMHEAEVPTWTTSDGTKLPVTTMDEGHLRNAISYCARRLSTKLTTATYVNECKRMVDGFSALLGEAERRGIRI